MDNQCRTSGISGREEDSTTSYLLSQSNFSLDVQPNCMKAYVTVILPEQRSRIKDSLSNTLRVFLLKASAMTFHVSLVASRNPCCVHSVAIRSIGREYVCMCFPGSFENLIRPLATARFPAPPPFLLLHCTGHRGLVPIQPCAFSLDLGHGFEAWLLLGCTIPVAADPRGYLCWEENPTLSLSKRTD